MPPPQPAAPIAPMPVVDLGTPAPMAAPAPTQRVCARCNGSCDGTAQFCKFCGAPLADAGARAPAKPAANGERNVSPHVPVSRAPTRPESPTARRQTPVDPFPTSDLAAAAAAAIAPAAPAPVAPPPAPVAAAAPGPPAPPAPVAASPAAAVAPRGRLVVIGKDGNEGPSYPLADQVDIGRTEGNVVVHDDKYLSPRHARLVRRGDKLWLRDLGSVNGIYLRLAKRAVKQGEDQTSVDHPLEDQDLILVGQQVIRFEVVRDADDGLGVAVEQDTLVFGTPAVPRHARLSVRTVEGVSRDVFYVRKNETVLGRESGDIVFTEDPFLSRRHCVFRRDGKRHLLTDLGSSNGTFVKLRGEVEVREGDQFRIGQQLFRVDLPRHS